jgi:hypothetical protein
MPITASLGALAYSKLSESGSFAGYWAIKAPTGSTTSFMDLKVATEQIRLIGSQDSSNIAEINVSGFTNPVITNNTLFNPPSGGSNSVIQYSTSSLSSNTTMATGTSLRVNSNAFPYYTLNAGTLTIMGATPSIIYVGLPSYGNPPGTNTLYKAFTDSVVDSTGNIYVVGHDTLPATVPPIAYTGRLLPYLYKFNSSFTPLATTQMGDAPPAATIPYGIYKPAVALDSSDNPIMSYGLAVTTTSSRIVLRKNDKTPTSVYPPYPGNPSIWQVGLTAPVSQPLGCSKIVVDSTGNIYATYFSTNNTVIGYVVKYNSTGTVLWQKSAGIFLQGMALKNDNEIYIVGNSATSLGYLVVYKINNAGNLLFQRRIGPSSGATGFNKGCSIQLNNSDMYITGNFTQSSSNRRPFLIKLPDDGTIPGSGTYTFSDATTATYAVSSYSYANSTMAAYTPGGAFGEISGNLLVSGASSSPQSTTRSIAFI